MCFLHVGQKGHCLAMLIVAYVKTVYCRQFDKETNHEKKQLIKYKEKQFNNY